ncbi:hypothetical protein TEA_016332 [Camellia sinensis var. sinensis]|uniref:Uncharacterized protein n=1 Tax=Camellia sinensis var. sinensis TaxID=542762 RepID=A0A4S4DAA1_CAMSN|nr:hypothetical protein TEA_016332 [Camellia sinensis var. sinensis]
MMVMAKEKDVDGNDDVLMVMMLLLMKMFVDDDVLMHTYIHSSMFGGGLVTVPVNSPHLRKSGSRPVVSDLGTSELGNSADEGFSHLLDANEMKGVSTPLGTAATILPSPILLWRFKEDEEEEKKTMMVMAKEEDVDSNDDVLMVMMLLLMKMFVDDDVLMVMMLLLMKMFADEDVCR